MEQLTLLIIDDEIDLLDVVKEQIEEFNLGLNIITADSVEKAKEVIGFCHIIISDINMPLREDLETLLKENNTKPIARITGHDDIKGELVIRKPFDPKVLKFVVEKLMGAAA